MEVAYHDNKNKMDLIPARNRNLKGASAEARSIVSHYTEKFSVITNNEKDKYDGTDGTGRNHFEDHSLENNAAPKGGKNNVWLTKKPYVGQNASIYVMLLDNAGEISGAPIEVNLYTDAQTEKEVPTGPSSALKPTSLKQAIELLETAKKGTDNELKKYYTVCVNVLKYNASLPNLLYLNKFKTNDNFIAFDKNGNPIEVKPIANGADAAAFDDGVEYYVDFDSAIAGWQSAWGPKPTDGDTTFKRTIAAETYNSDWASSDEDPEYCWLLAPSGGVAQPKAYKEGSQFVYKVNVPSILYQDIVLLDYYVEYRHNATQVSILPDKFAPYMYVEGSSLIRRASDGMDLPVEFVIPKLKIKTAISFTFQSTGDASTFNFQGDAYPDFSKFDLTRKVLADIQILDADDNYDGAGGDNAGDPTSYRRYQYNDDTDGEYLWKDPSIEQHNNIDYSDARYVPDQGGPASVNYDANDKGEINPHGSYDYTAPSEE